MAFGGFDDQRNQPMAEINTTPLVDVMLVLLVIFIITAPLFNQAVPIDLPKVSASEQEDKPQVLHVALDADDRLYLEDRPIRYAELIQRFSEAAAGSEHPELHLRADRDTRYEAIVRIMAAARHAGVARIAFVTDPSLHPSAL
jgi:biopolymer transport protein ExbD